MKELVSKMWAGKGMGEHPVAITSRVLFPSQCQGVESPPAEEGAGVGWKITSAGPGISLFTFLLCLNVLVTKT